MLSALENSEDKVPLLVETTVQWPVRPLNMTVEYDKCRDGVMSICGGIGGR